MSKKEKKIKLPIKSVEKPKHLQAFERYVALGIDRSMEKLIPLYPEYNLNSLKVWSRHFDWQRRVQIRDKQIAELAEKKTDSSLAKTIAGERKHINDIQTIIYRAIARTLIKDKITGELEINPLIVPTSARDLKDLSYGYGNLSKLKLQIDGFQFVGSGSEGQTNILNLNQQIVLYLPDNQRESLEVKPGGNGRKRLPIGKEVKQAKDNKQE